MKYNLAVVNQLSINKLRLEVHLGWTDEERAKPQPVEVSVFIRFPEPPPATKTDALSDTVCYAAICECLQGLVREHRYKLIEHLTAEIYTAAKSKLPAGAGAHVELTKIQVPVPNLLGGATFTYGDF